MLDLLSFCGETVSSGGRLESSHVLTDFSENSIRSLLYTWL